ncbi:MAG: hypothetical protein NVS4B3_19670 [Gemmatimonadaceae bacterium]
MRVPSPVPPAGADEDPDERSGSGPPRPTRWSRRRIWTRKIHNYLGLYLLFFLWLFSISGLVLNHSSWPFTQFWPTRRESTRARPIRRPLSSDDLPAAMDLMRQLAIVGEIGETKRTPDGGRLEFQVVKPGRIVRVRAQLDSARATISETRVNGWGVLDAMHKFTGVRMEDPSRDRHWVVTRMWSLAMDALSLGLVILVASGFYLWYGLPEKRRPGVVAMLLGAACCAFFLYGLGARM